MSSKRNRPRIALTALSSTPSRCSRPMVLPHRYSLCSSASSDPRRESRCVGSAREETTPMRLLCVLSLLLLTISTAATGQTKSRMALFPATEIEWKDGPPSFTQGRQDGRPGGRSDAARHVHHAPAIPGRLPGVSALAHADRARDDRGRHAPPGDGGAVRSCVYANLGHRLVRLLARGDEAFRLGRGRDDSPAARSGALDHHLRQRNRRPADSAPVTNPTFVATANLRIGPH